MPKTALEVLSAMLEDQGAATKPKTVVEALGMLGDAVDPSGIGQHIADWVEEHQDEILSDDSVTGNKILDGTVGTNDLANGAVTDAKLSPTGIRAKVASLAGNVLRGTGSGAVVTATGAYAAPPLGLTVDGRSVQDGTPTPSSPVAIDSIENLSLMASGANLLRNNGVTTTTNGITFTVNSDGTVTANGTATANAWFEVNGGFAIPSQCFLSGRPTVGITGGSAGGAQLQTGINGVTYQDVGSGVAIPAGQSSVFYIVIRKDAVCTNAVFRPMLNVGTSALPYVSYDINGSTTAIDLQGHELRSLPDGTHDELTVDADGNVTLVQRVGSKAMTVIDQYNNRTIDGTTYYTYGNNTFTDRRAETTIKASSYISDCFGSSSTSAQNTDAPNMISFNRNTSSRYMYVQTSVASTPSAMNEWLAEHGATVQYALATPVTHDLGTVTLPATPAPDLTAWADTNPPTTIALDYERDANVAFDDMRANIAPIEQAVATANHATGSLMMLGGRLVKATTAIAIGEPVAIGNNVAATTVAAEMALKADA